MSDWLTLRVRGRSEWLRERAASALASGAEPPSVEAVKRLRAAIGAGVVDCRNALIVARGDFDLAVEILPTKSGGSAA